MRITPERIIKELQGEQTTTITIAKPYCSPSRHLLTGILDALHIWFDAPAFDKWGPPSEAFDGNPAYQTAEIVVKKKQAVWAEYVILSAKTPTGSPIFQVLGKMQNPKNAAWAAKRKGVPTPWDIKSGKITPSWTEHGCKPAKDLGVQNSKGQNATVKGFGGILFTSERQRPERKRKQRRSRSRRR